MTPTRTASLQDAHDIANVMTGWVHRDVGEWDQLGALFHPDAQIKLSWFTGPATDFVAASARMARSDLRTKHVIATPSIRFSRSGLRAVTETNAIVVVENRHVPLGAVGHSRFFDRVECRDGRWAIVERTAIYDFSSFTFPLGPVVSIDAAAVSRYPIEYAALAYVLDLGGFPVGDTFATKDGDDEREMKRCAAQWLDDVDVAADR
ncbi:nuclear transport factor 2 family protein [Mycolicibacterium mengxianglii]|uniref:nuclear transport factor 2 family protein n=1 Tax=Mycolicibacterium mengxianglii TaxID=2736649 RepID=UPI0018EEE0CA|nr:nuclear transport factor 2 family protein [Mycolicibacterium mengxianglii]